MDKLKNIDWKQFGINHGEKIGITVVVLLAAFALYSSRWMGDKRTSRELEKKALDTQMAMENSDWPTDKEVSDQGDFQFLDIANIEDRANRMGSAVGFEKYVFTTELTWPLTPQRKKRSKLEMVAPQNLQVSYVTDAFAERKSVSDSNEDGKDGAEKDGKSSDDEDKEEDIGSRFNGDDVGGGGGGAKNGRSVGGLGGGGLSGLDGGELSGGGLGGLSGGDLAGGGLAGGGLAGGGLGGGRKKNRGRGVGGLNDSAGNAGGLAGAEDNSPFKAEGRRAVTVRAIVDVYRQREQLARSLHLPLSHPLVTSSLKYLDYKIQRKVAVPGDDPWSSDWEDVDTQVAVDMIRKANKLDPEKIDSAVTNEAMTMPLPQRLTEKWGKEVSHPRIEDFTLSSSQIDRQKKQDELIRKHYEALQKKKKKKQGKRGARGWSNDALNQQEKESELASDKNAWKKYKKDLEEAGLTETSNSAVGNLFLFRYIDFAVEQGKTYRYRVRVELANPHFGLPPDELEDYALAEREVLETDWSEPSGPIDVPYDYQYFVNKVQGGIEPEAVVNMFLWYYESGTSISADDELDRSGGLKVKVGDFIGGEKKSYVLRMDKKTLNKEKVQFESRDILLGASTPALDPNVLTDLKTQLNAMDRDARSALGARLTVARPDGDILTVSTPYGDRTLARRRNFMRAMDKHFDGLGWKDREGTAVASGGSALGGGLGGGAGLGNYGGDGNNGGPPAGQGGPPAGYGGDGDGAGGGGPPAGYNNGAPPGRGG
jgi:hypothetical protein